jgi:putative MFS transporter
MIGFAGMALGMLLLMFAAMAGDGPQGPLGLIIAGFVLFNFAMNAGPNATTFTLPPVLFPTAIRASASGFAAACGKGGCDVRNFSGSSTAGKLGD